MEESVLKGKGVSTDVAGDTVLRYPRKKDDAHFKFRNALISRLNSPKTYKHLSSFAASTPKRRTSPTNLAMNWQLSPVVMLLPDLQLPENKVKKISPAKTTTVKRVPECLPMIERKRTSDRKVPSGSVPKKAERVDSDEGTRNTARREATSMKTIGNNSADDVEKYLPISFILKYNQQQDVPPLNCQVMDLDEEEKYMQGKSRTKRKEKQPTLRDIENLPIREEIRERIVKSAAKRDGVGETYNKIKQRVTRSAGNSNSLVDTEPSNVIDLQSSVSGKSQGSKAVEAKKVSGIPRLKKAETKLRNPIEDSADRRTEDELPYSNKDPFRNPSMKVVHSPKRPIVAIRSTLKPAKHMKSAKKTSSSTRICKASGIAFSKIPRSLNPPGPSVTKKSRVSFDNPLSTDIERSHFNRELNNLKVQNGTFCIFENEQRNIDRIRQSTRIAGKHVNSGPLNGFTDSEYEITNKLSEDDRIFDISTDTEAVINKAQKANDKSKRLNSLQKAEAESQKPSGMASPRITRRNSNCATSKNYEQTTKEVGSPQRDALAKKKRVIAGGKATSISSKASLDEDEIPAKQQRTDRESKPEESGVRRSARPKYRPLEYWNGERVPFKNDSILPLPRTKPLYNKARTKGQSMSERNDRKKKTLTVGRKEDGASGAKETSSIETGRELDERDTDMLKGDGETRVRHSDLKSDIVFEPNVNSSTIGVKTTISIPVNGKNIQMECLTDYATMHSNSKPIPGAHGDVVFGNGLETAMGAVSSGSIEMSPNSSKGTQTPKSHHLIFCVMTGSIVVTIHHARKKIETGGHFFIPCGISYNITNFGDGKAVLSFFKITRGCISLDMSDQ